MTALHSVAPVQRTGEATVSALPNASPRTAEALELLRAAEAVGGDAARPCGGATTCRRPGALTVVTEDGTTDLCGLHAMSVVFSTTAGPLVLVKPGH